ncbi:MAG: hypothetical protein Tsb0017_16660 [Geothermobacteraceae bacterium]
MGPDPILALHQEDMALRSGVEVTAFWFDFRGRYRARARVEALRTDQVRVQLLEAAGPFRVGSLVDIPRISDSSNWSSEHCVRLEVSGV